MSVYVCDEHRCTPGHSHGWFGLPAGQVESLWGLSPFIKSNEGEPKHTHIPKPPFVLKQAPKPQLCSKMQQRRLEGELDGRSFHPSSLLLCN